MGRVWEGLVKTRQRLEERVTSERVREMVRC